MKPSTFSVTISKDWSEKDPSSYDPTDIVKERFSNSVDALEFIRTTVAALPHYSLGYIVTITACGPRGRNRGMRTELTSDHVNADGLVAKMAANFFHW